jgi:chromosome segregation ATPase
MTDIVEQLENATRRAEYWKLEHIAANAEIESLRQQLSEWTTLFSEWDSPGEVHEALIGLQKDINALRQQLAGCREDRQRLKESLAEVVLISDRRHDAWLKAKRLLAKEMK